MRKYRCRSCRGEMWLDEHHASCCFCDSSHEPKEVEEDYDERETTQLFLCVHCETEWEVEVGMEPDICPCCGDDLGIIETS